MRFAKFCVTNRDLGDAQNLWRTDGKQVSKISHALRSVDLDGELETVSVRKKSASAQKGHYETGKDSDPRAATFWYHQRS